MKPGICRLIAVCFALLFYATLNAAPLKYIPISITQPDGKVINCFASGDEFYNWVHDKDGYTILRNPNTGYFVYAIKENGHLMASEYVVGRDDGKRYLLQKNVIDSPEVIMQIRNLHLKKQSQMLQEKISRFGSSPAGDINNIVIFIRFSDEPEFVESILYYNNYFNDPGINSNSVSNYFKTISYGKVSVRSTLFSSDNQNNIISYRDEHTRNYYKPYVQGSNDSGYIGRGELRELELLKNALKSIQAKIPPEMNVDGNDDGFVDNICFIVSGSTTAWNTVLWPHMSYFPLEDGISINGKMVWTYNLQLENYFTTSVLDHELLHSIGLPDLYHYTFDSISPIGPWDIMAETPPTPPHPSIYMKAHYGNWASSIPEIKADGRYYLKPSSLPGGNGYIIRSPNSYKEYFLLEYRKDTDIFERSLPWPGLLLYRICPFYSGNSQATKNGMPDEIYVFRPSGSLTENGEIRNASMSTERNLTSIGDDQNPACFLFDGGRTGIRIYNVGTCGDSIAFDVKFTSSLYNPPVVLSPLPPEKLYSDPSGLDIFKRKTKKNIKWSGFTGSSVKIEYSLDDGMQWKTAVENVPSLQGEFEWTVPDTVSDACRIKISNSAHSSIDARSAMFSIADWDRTGRVTYNRLMSVFAPDSERVFAGGFNALLLYSSDAGNSWETRQIPSSMNIKQVFCRKDTVWLLSSDAGNILLKSTDNGYSWKKIFIPTLYAVQNVVFTEENTGYCTDNSGYIFKSPDGGDTWRKLFFQAGAAPEKIYFYDRNNGYVLASSIYRTADGGESWKKVESVSDGPGKYFMDCCFTDRNNGWISGASTAMISYGIVLKTTDGGNTWKEIILPQLRSVRKIQFVNKMGWALGDYNLIFQTRDGSETWQKTATGAVTGTLFDISARDGKIFTAGDNGIILSSEYSSTDVSSTEDNSGKIMSYNLRQNYPNPFNPSTQIEFSLKISSRVTLTVYNLLGEQINTLLDEYLSAGEHSVTFNGASLPSGFYFYHIQAGEFAETKKMLLLK